MIDVVRMARVCLWKSKASVQKEFAANGVSSFHTLAGRNNERTYSSFFAVTFMNFSSLL